MWDCQVLGVGIVGVNNGTGFSQGCEVLLGGGRIVRVKRSYGSIRVDNKLGLGGSKNTGQYLERRMLSVRWALSCGLWFIFLYPYQKLHD